MNETTKKIEELRKEVDRIQSEIRELEKQNSNYYIGMYVGMYEEHDGDFYDYTYQRLGFISEDKARAWVNEQYKNNRADNVKYFEVTAEVYRKYGDWCDLVKLYRAINTYNPAIKALDNVSSFKETVKDAMHRLEKELGVYEEYDSTEILSEIWEYSV